MKIILISILFTACSSIAYCQKSDTLKRNSYQIDFVFTGEIHNHVDSTFALQYSFLTADISRFRTLVMENSKRRQLLNLSVKERQNEMEIKREQGKVKIVIYQYDKYDLPVLIQAEDSLRRTYPLYLRSNKGSYFTASQVKNQVKTMREAIIRHKAENTDNETKPKKQL